MRQAWHKDKAIPTEGETVELKESLGEWKEIVKTCAAFATARGGRLYIGVADDGRIIGIQIGKGTLEDLANKIAQNTVPKLVPAITTFQEQSRTIICVEVAESPTKPVTAFDRGVRRSGKTNQVLSASEIAELYFATRGVTWDQTTRSDATIEDVDASKVAKFLSRARTERQWEIDPQTRVEQALRQLNLTYNGQLTIAALLLFGGNPQQFITQAKLRCARFKGDDEAVFLDLKVIEGDIIGQVEGAMTFVRRNTSMAVKIEGKLERTEEWEYPLDAVREAITNAVCHRDYASSGNVQVRIFDHSLVVSNPGMLPSDLTIEDLRIPHESKPRNKLVADAFFLIKYIEQFGTGTRRMINDCREAGVPEPEFESHGDAFRTTFRKVVPIEQSIARMRLNERQKKALRHVAEKGSMTRAEYESVADTTERTAKRDLNDMVKRYILMKKGRGNNFWYVLVGPQHGPENPEDQAEE